MIPSHSHKLDATRVADDAFDEDLDLPPSKSQRKRDMLALQDIATALVDLSHDQLNKVQMSSDLLAAVFETKRTRSHEGIRRQMQYLGKLMRRLDEGEIEVIQRALANFARAGKEETNKLHRIERLRDTLIDDDNAVTTFFTEHPHADVQTIRTVIRNARKERARQQEQPLNRVPPKHSRELFQAIKSVLTFVSEEAASGAVQIGAPEDGVDAQS